MNCNTKDGDFYTGDIIVEHYLQLDDNCGDLIVNTRKIEIYRSGVFRDQIEN